MVQIAELLVTKEMKTGKKVVNPHLFMESESKKNKIRSFVKPYIEKVIHHNKKRAQKGTSHRSSKKVEASLQSELESALAMSPIADAANSVSPETPATGSQPTSPGGTKRKRGDDAEFAPESPKRVKSPVVEMELGSAPTSVSPDVTTPAVSSTDTEMTRPPTSPTNSKRRRDDEEEEGGKESPKRARNSPSPMTGRITKSNGVSVC